MSVYLDSRTATKMVKVSNNHYFRTSGVCWVWDHKASKTTVRLHLLYITTNYLEGFTRKKPLLKSNTNSVIVSLPETNVNVNKKNTFWQQTRGAF